ncbi:MAG: hypothetical protein JWO98_5271 [Frankiales bacterium]|nr:hypothetical protein [Frankiales bacterium]
MDLTHHLSLPKSLTVDVSMAAGSTPAASGPRTAGVTAQLAEARRLLRNVTPADSWDAVLAEVQRLQADRGIPLLAALHAVYAKIAGGWSPGAGRSGV